MDPNQNQQPMMQQAGPQTPNPMPQQPTMPQTPAPKQGNNMMVMVLIVVVVLVVGGVVGYFLLFNKASYKTTPSYQSQPTTYITPKPTPTPTDNEQLQSLDPGNIDTDLQDVTADAQKL